MRMTIPLPLRRSLMASVLIPVSLSFSASAADFMVDAAQTSDPAHNIYTTLNDLASSGSLAAGDTVVLNNDDASLTTSLTVPVNFRSDDPDMPCTVDLSGLGNNPMYNLAEGEYTLDMDSVIWANGNRRAIQAQGGDISLKITGHVQFLNNSILSGTGLNAGGAIYMSGINSIMALGDHVIFHGNRAYSYGFNYDTSYGGAIYMSGINSTIMTFGDHASFSDNYAYGSSDGAGGAIYMKGNNISLTIRNGASFTNNYAFVNGGAIFLDGNNTNKFSRFLAFTNDVLFSGNMTGGTFTQHDNGSFSVENGIANSIHVSGTNHLQLAAAQGREVRFNDPITSSDYSTVTLSLNQYTDDEGNTHATDGSVIFSGELYQGDDAHLVASRYSNFKGQTTLYGGTLILEHNVVFGNAGLRDDTSMTLEHGTLEITGGSVINAASFSITNGDAVLRPGTTAFINAKNVDLSRGFVFDMQKQAQEAASPANATGLSISATGSFTLGGSIGIMDTGTTADYFYADNSWAQQRAFIVLTDANQTHTDDFSGVHSLATGSGQVDSPYAYTGSWSHQWVDVDGDGFPEQLQLVWTPAEDAAIRDILPELAGTLAMNSMWSSASNAKNMSRAALGNLDAQRFIAGPENNYWVKGMGDFLNHASEGVRDGFDYHGGGYSVGADRRITSHAILGLGFGDLYGRMRGRSFAGDIDQQTRIGMLYGGWHKVLNRKNTLLVTGTAGYGWTDNKMNSFHTGGRSHGKWTNETLFGTFTGKWSRRVNETVAMEVMLGLEYTDVTQEAFTETGWDAM